MTLKHNNPLPICCFACIDLIFLGLDRLYTVVADLIKGLPFFRRKWFNGSCLHSHMCVHNSMMSSAMVCVFVLNEFRNKIFLITVN